MNKNCIETEPEARSKLKLELEPFLNDNTFSL